MQPEREWRGLAGVEPAAKRLGITSRTVTGPVPSSCLDPVAFSRLATIRGAIQRWPWEA